MTIAPKNKIALFLDRDGIVNIDFGYVWQVEKLKFQIGLKEILKYFRQKVDCIIVISNQSGIGREMYSMNDWNKFNAEINRKLSLSGLKIDEFYCCPHLPNLKPRCDCRKPGIGMLLQAQRDFNVSLKESLLIGDKITDILAANSAGLDRAYLLSQEDNLVDLSFENIDFQKVKVLTDILKFEKAKR